jgi:acyl-CoA thioesterase-1
MSETYGSCMATVKPWLRIFVAALFALVVTGTPVLANKLHIVAFGDSLMAGYMLARNDGFPYQLQRALNENGYDVEVINASVSGDTTSGGVERLDWSVPDGADLVILELGANDALRGISPEVTEQNLGTIIRRLRQRGIGVVLAGMLAPPNMGSEYEAAFNPIYPRLAKRFDVPLYPFILDGVATHDDLQLDDGMHPNPDGVAVMVKGILPIVENAIKRVEEK